MRKHDRNFTSINSLRSALFSFFVLATPVFAGDYSNHPEAEKFVKRMVEKHGFKKEEVQSVIDQAVKKQAILDAISRPAEKTKPWHEYRNIFLGEKRIQQGVEFWSENENVLNTAAEKYGVAPEIIVAIIGVETRYGRYMGSWRVLDALTTLGFDYPPRAKFFSSELEQAFLLAKEQKQDLTELTGSYAGAMGFGQFIPSSYRRYARDYDGDNIVDIWNNKSDAIVSVANYFKAHGWQTGEPVVQPVKLAKAVEQRYINTGDRPKENTVKSFKKMGVQLSEKMDASEPAVLLEYEGLEGPEYWLGFNNFYVITRYNRSRMYALAVWQLSQAIVEARSRALSIKSN